MSERLPPGRKTKKTMIGMSHHHNKGKMRHLINVLVICQRNNDLFSYT